MESDVVLLNRYSFKKLFILFAFIFVIVPSSASAQIINMMWPLNGPITSEFGWRTHPIYGTPKYHSGLDIGGDYGEPICAAAAGTVIHSGWISGYGYAVIIDHGGGLTTLYGHNEELLVYVGQVVKQGQVIAHCGSTGNSTGPHCHFEVRQDGEAVSPYDYLGINYTPTGDGSGFSPGKFLELMKMKFDETMDFGLHLRNASQMFVEVAAGALKRAMNIIHDLLLCLIIIEFAYKSLLYVFDTEAQFDNFISRYIRNLIFYAVLLWMASEWPTVIANIMKDMLLDYASITWGFSTEELGKAVSDPTAILQKSASIIAPLVNYSSDFEWSLAWFFKNGISGILSEFIWYLMSDFFICVIEGGFIVITFNIVFAYIEYYLMIAFSFCTFFMAGHERTRLYAQQGINGLFASSLKLFFFTMYAVLVLHIMNTIIIEDLVKENNEPSSPVYTSAEAAAPKTWQDYYSRAIQVESSGNFNVYNGLEPGEPFQGLSGGRSGAYGALQNIYTYWDERCMEYEAATGQKLHRGDENDHCPSDFPNSPSRYNSINKTNGVPLGEGTAYAWCPENQRAVDSFRIQNLWKEGESFPQGPAAYVAQHWLHGSATGPLDADEMAYYMKICGAKGQLGPKMLLKFMALLKVTLVVFMFVWFGSIGQSIYEKFGGKGGFRFTTVD